MPISGKYWTSKELQELLGTSKQAIYALSKKYNWYSPVPGLYLGGTSCQQDTVDAYILANQRKKILGTRELVWHDDFDIGDCPKCGDICLDMQDNTYKCQNGHVGNIEDI